MKDNGKRAEAKIKRFATSKPAPVNYDSDESVRILRKKRVRNGVLPNRKQQRKKSPKHHGEQRYCVIFKKARTTEKNYMSHSYYNCFGKSYDQ